MTFTGLISYVRIYDLTQNAASIRILRNPRFGMCETSNIFLSFIDSFFFFFFFCVYTQLRIGRRVLRVNGIGWALFLVSFLPSHVGEVIKDL